MRSFTLLCRTIGVAFLMGVVVYAASCTKGEEVIKIGIACPLTGDSAQFGQMMKLGVDLKLSEYNEQGGLHGKQLVMVQGDDKADPKEAGVAAQKLASDPEVVAVVGHFNSSCSKIAKPIYKQNKIIQVSPGSTNDEVCIGSEFTFRNIYRDDFQGQSLARYVKNVLGLSRVAVIYDNDDYGAGLKNNFAEEAQRLGLEVVATEAFTRTTQEFTPQLTKIQETNPEIIFISGLFTQGAQIASQARKLGIQTQLLGADGMLSPDLVALGGKSVEGAILSVPFLNDGTDPKVNAFFAAFKKKYNETPDAWAALSYDAAGIICEAIKKAGTDAEAIRKAVAAFNSPQNGFPGITGLTYFDENGDCLKPLTFAVVKNGEFTKAEKQLP